MAKLRLGQVEISWTTISNSGSGADYTSIQDAITAGKYNLLILGNFTETKNVTIVNNSVNIKITDTCNMGEFNFSMTGSGDLTIESGKLTASYTSPKTLISNTGTGTFHHADLIIDISASTAAATIFNGASGNRVQGGNCRCFLSDNANAGFINCYNSSSLNNIEFVGGGSNCEGAIINLASGIASNLFFSPSGTFKVSGDLITLENASSILSNVIYDAINRPIISLKTNGNQVNNINGNVVIDVTNTSNNQCSNLYIPLIDLSDSSAGANKFTNIHNLTVNMTVAGNGNQFTNFQTGADIIISGGSNYFTVAYADDVIVNGDGNFFFLTYFISYSDSGTFNSNIDFISDDETLANNSSRYLVTEKAIKAYSDHFSAITKEPTGFTSPENITVNYDSTTRKITLTGTVNGYYRGTQISALTSGWISDAHSVTNGQYVLVYNGTSFAWVSPSALDFSHLLIAFVNYGTTDKWALRECHGIMPWQTHKQLHEVIGTYRNSGGDIADYVLNSTTVADRQPSVSATVLIDEDLSTTNPALAASGNYTQFYLSSTDTANFNTTATDIVPLSGNQPYYNQFTGGAWQQTLMSANNYMSVWLVGMPMTADTDSQNYRYFWIQGQTESLVLANQQALTPNDVNLGELQNLTPELVFMSKIIIRYVGGNWQLIEVERIDGTRFSQTSSPQGAFLSSVSSDSTLTGNGTAGSPLGIALSNDNIWTGVQEFESGARFAAIAPETGQTVLPVEDAGSNVSVEIRNSVSSTRVNLKTDGNESIFSDGILAGTVNISGSTIEDSTNHLNITASGTLKNINITATGSILNTISDGGSGFVYSIEGTSDNKLIYENNGKFTLTNVSDTDSDYGRYTYRGTASSLENGPNTVIHLGSDVDPVFQHVNWDHDNINIGFDAYTVNGTNWVSSDTGSNCLFSKNSDEFKILYDSGTTKGTAITWNDGFRMDLTNGHIGLGIAPSASYQLLVNGDYKIGCQAIYGQSDISLLGNDGTDSILIDNSTSQITITATGGLFASTVYNSSVTGRDVYVDPGGRIGYLSSIRISKTNIQDLNDCEVIYNLKPKSFYKRKKLSEIKSLQNNIENVEDDYYTDEYHPDLCYGLLAEDVEEEDINLVFYGANGELEGIYYQKLITPIIKCLQLQNERLNKLEL